MEFSVCCLAGLPPLFQVTSRLRKLRPPNHCLLHSGAGLTGFSDDDQARCYDDRKRIAGYCSNNRRATIEADLESSKKQTSRRPLLHYVREAEKKSTKSATYNGSSGSTTFCDMSDSESLLSPARGLTVAQRPNRSLLDWP